MRAVRFSTRTLFVAVAVCAVIALLLSWAMRGGILGDLGLVVGMAAAMGVMIMVVHVAFVMLCQAVATAAARRQQRSGVSRHEELKEGAP